jgi:hypothetical protein
LLEVGFENIDEFCFHEKISHGFDDVVVSACRQQHVIDSFLEEGEDYAGEEETEYVEVSHHLEDGVLWELDADKSDDRLA